MVSDKRFGLLKQALWLLSVPLLCAVVAVRHGQDTNWDLQNYHLYNPYAFLHGRLTLDLAAAGLQTYFNPFIDLAWFALLQLLPPAGVGALLGFLHGLNFVLVYLIARALLPDAPQQRLAAWLLAMAGMLSVGFRSELGNTMHDNLVSLFILMSLLLVIRAQSKARSERWRSLLLAGVLAGVACALKLVVSIYALGLCLALLAWPQPWQQKSRSVLVYSAGIGTGLLLAGAYWFHLMWSSFGNPLFPQFNSWFGGALADLLPIRDERFLPVNWLEYFSYPFLMSLQPGRVSDEYFRQYSWACVYVALILAVVKAVCLQFSNRQSGTSTNSLSCQVRLLLVFFGCSLLLWLHLFGIYRYLVTLDLLLPLVLVLTASYLSAKWGFRVGAVLVVLLTLANFKGAPNWGHSNWTGQAYTAEQPADADRVGTILLIGQPLAWLVPALDLPIPFLQLAPNFPVGNSHYFQTLRDRIDRNKTVLAIFDPAINTMDAAAGRVAEIHYTLQKDECKPLAGHLGSKLLLYQYCPVIKSVTEPE